MNERKQNSWEQKTVNKSLGKESTLAYVDRYVSDLE